MTVYITCFLIFPKKSDQVYNISCREFNMVSGGLMHGDYTLYSVICVMMVLLAVWFLYYEFRHEMVGEPFVSGVYDPGLSSQWVYFPLFGQRVSRTGVAYYDHPFQLYLREYKVYPNVADVLAQNMKKLAAATKAAAVPVLPIAPVPTDDTSPDASTEVPDTGKKAIVTVPTSDGNKNIVAPIVNDGSKDKAIVNIPTTKGNTSIALNVPDVSKKIATDSAETETPSSAEGFAFSSLY